MHDAVGHRVSLMVLQAGAIEMAAADAARVQELAANVQTAGRQALDELRQMVGVLRGGEVDEDAPLGPAAGSGRRPPPGRQRAGRRHARRAAGRAAGRRPGRGARGLPDRPGGAHQRGQARARARGSRVAVERTATGLGVRVLNGPPNHVPAGASGGGYGLVGLAERVRTLGGRLTAEPRLDGGFEIDAELPA